MMIYVQHQLTLHDAGAFCDAVHDFNVEFHQLDCGILKAKLAFLVTSDCSIQHVSFNRRFHQRGCGPDDMLCFGLPDKSTLRSWNGTSYEQEKLLNFSGPNGYDSVSECGFSAYTFSVSEPLLQRALDAFGSTTSAFDIRAGGDWFLPDANLRDRLRSIAYQSLSKSSASSWQSSRFKNLEIMLANTLAQAITAGEPVSERNNISIRNRAISKSLELIYAGPDPFCISDLQKHSGVCWRTLDRAFKERFGMGPKQYTVAVRLAQVRNLLRSTPPTRTITELASESGFDHLGRFSSSYKEMFGELPSQTRRK
jgi:AraC family ethanolamine operon transcriptional activator